jgi:predicted ribosome quality control (RQC) complex YloA/Tae2 family protein
MGSILSLVIKHWKEVALILILFVVTFFWCYDNYTFMKAYDSTVENYEKQIQILQESYAREAERKEQALREYEEKLKTLETEYEDYKEKLEAIKTERVGELVILRHEDPESLIREIEETFGFEHVR